MNGGRLRHLIKIQRYTLVTNEYGEQEKIWNTLAEVRAEINPISGKEDFDEKEKKSDVTTKILIRYPGFKITPKDRCVIGDMIDTEYNILFVQNYNLRNRDIILLCQEKVGSNNV